MEDKDDEVQRALVSVLSSVGSNEAFNIIIKILNGTNNYDTIAACTEAIINIKKQEGFDYLKDYENIVCVKNIIDEYKEILTYDETEEILNENLSC